MGNSQCHKKKKIIYSDLSLDEITNKIVSQREQNDKKLKESKEKFKESQEIYNKKSRLKDEEIEREKEELKWLMTYEYVRDKLWKYIINTYDINKFKNVTINDRILYNECNIYNMNESFYIEFLSIDRQTQMNYLERLAEEINITMNYKYPLKVKMFNNVLDKKIINDEYGRLKTSYFIPKYKGSYTGKYKFLKGIKYGPTNTRLLDIYWSWDQEDIKELNNLRNNITEVDKMEGEYIN